MSNSAATLRILLLAALLCCNALGSIAGAAQSCSGDADGDSSVSVAEIVQAVRNALFGCPGEEGLCNGDTDCNGNVVVAELVQAVRAALFGCADPLPQAVDVAWLAARLDDPSLQILDARVGGFSGGHIPGALPLSPYELAATVGDIPFQIADAATAETVLRAVGLRTTSTAVVYGTSPEFDPARVVWALRYLGHADVRYLDGGWTAWMAAAEPVAAGDPARAGPSDYDVGPLRDDIRVSGDWVLDQLGPPPYTEPAIQLVDARSDAEFAAGRIPTAVHAPWTINLDGLFLAPRAELAALYENLGLDPQRTTVVYCLAGWRASVAWFVLTGVGFADVRVYDGSWLEWGDGTFPIETD